MGVAPVDGLVSTDYTVARPTEDVETRYIAALLKTPRALTEIDKWSHGMVRDRNRLYWQGFKNIRFPLPPLEEQRRILTEMDRSNDAHARFEDLASRAIERLVEYRSALITAAVTGDLDVRGAA